MADTETTPISSFTKTVVINAAPAKVWATLTDTTLMKQWMSETPIDIITDWKVGSPMIIKGDWYKTGFENKGVVLAFEPEKLLTYSHLSSLSRLADTVENYTVLSFVLTAHSPQTTLVFTATNFPTDTIYRHIAFYWNVTLELMKKHACTRTADSRRNSPFSASPVRWRRGQGGC